MPSHDDLLVLGAADVLAALDGQEEEVISLVGRAYRAHQRGDSSLPHSIFLRFPDDDTNRIIGLPAFLGDGFGVAGMKWIASFPGNLEKGMARASAVLVLNSTDTGRPLALLESSIISARRTAASAALAARTLLAGEPPERVGLVGTGLINLETVRFLVAALPGVRRFLLFDLDGERAAAFGRQVRRLVGDAAQVEIAADGERVLRSCPLVSYATTAIRPHVTDLSPCPPRAVILHTSLRDLQPEAILAADNVVDDADHVCRAGTSVHLTEQRVGHRDFIRCSLAEILNGDQAPRTGDDRVTVFSPFGLGILDVAVGQLVLERSRSAGRGTSIPGFLATETVGAEAD